MKTQKQYWQKLQDPRWQRKRLEILNRAEFCCESCGDTESQLQVHHGYYEKGKAAVTPKANFKFITATTRKEKSLGNTRMKLFGVFATSAMKRLTLSKMQ